MSAASLAAYERILPDLPRRERQVLNLLIGRLRENPSGPSGLTCREIANKLNLDRDSVSPRIGSLQNKGLVVPAGIFGKETIFEAYNDPTNAKPRPVRKSRPYRTAIDEAAAIVERYLQAYPKDIFTEPPYGQHGKSVDSCSAAALRAVLPNVLRDIRNLKDPG